jgi:hypothetical protein
VLVKKKQAAKQCLDGPPFAPFYKVALSQNIGLILRISKSINIFAGDGPM